MNCSNSFYNLLTTGHVNEFPKYHTFEKVALTFVSQNEKLNVIFFDYPNQNWDCIFRIKCAISKSISLQHSENLWQDNFSWINTITFAEILELQALLSTTLWKFSHPLKRTPPRLFLPFPIAYVLKTMKNKQAFYSFFNKNIKPIYLQIFVKYHITVEWINVHKK